MPNTNENHNIGQSQCAQIRRHLEAGHSLTGLQALSQFSCFRLAARIDDLRNAGMLIESQPISVINADGKTVRVAQYSLMTAEAIA